MPTTIDQLQIEIETNSDKASSGISKLTDTLSRLKKATSSSGLDAVSKTLEKISSFTFSNLDSLKKINEITGNLKKVTEKVDSLTSSASQVPAEISTKTNVEGTQRAESFISSVSDKISEIPKKVSVHVSAPGAPKATSDVSAFRNVLNLTKRTAIGLKEKLKQTGKGISQIGRIVLVYGMAFRAFSAITTGISDGLKNLAAYSSETNSNLSQLSTCALYAKNSLAAALYPTIVNLLPAINALTDGFVRCMNVISQFVSAMSGATSYTKAKKYMQSFAETAKSTANKIKKSFAGMDEITVIGQPSSASAASSTPDYSQMFETSPISSSVSAIADSIAANMQEVEKLIGEFSLAVGAVLLFSGANIPLGLGLMAFGAYKLGKSIAEDWGALDTPIQTKVDDILKILSIGAFVVGAIIAFSGANVPLGIALMVGGAAALGASTALNWNGLSDNVKAIITEIGIAVGAVLLVLGVILAFSGAAIPLGIGLIVAGALILGEAVNLGWDKLPDNIKNIITIIGLAVGAALLVLGIVLAFTGVALPLGIALMVAGAAGIIGVAKLGWDTLPQKTKNILSIIGAAVSAALLVLGIIFICTGVGIPLGIAMLVAGAAGLVGIAAVNWDWVKDKINTVLASALAIISGFGLVLGILLCLTGAGIPLGIGLIIASLKGVKKASDMDDNPITRFVKNMANGIIGIFESAVNFIIKMLNKLHWDVPDWVPLIGGSTFGFSITPVSIPRLKNGGFPDGEDGLFYANHGEMVGKFSNGKTAVANNDQIVEGITNGVAAANYEQNELLRKQNKLLMALLEKETNNEIGVTTITKAMQRKNRRDGKTIVPVGT